MATSKPILTFLARTFKGFCLGLTLGILLTYVIFHYNNYGVFHDSISNRKDDLNNGVLDEVHGHSSLSEPNRPKNLRIDSNVDFNKDMDDYHHKQANSSIFKIKVLCWIMTSPKSIYQKGKAVKETWGKRCDVLLFMSSQDDITYPAINLDVPEGPENLWFKTRAAWEFVFDHHLYDADWFLKADDDTFVIVENLKYLCSKYDPDEAHYFGRYYGKYGGFNSGPAGYVFSRETLKKFVNVLGKANQCSSGQSSREDVEVGRCLAYAGVSPGDSRDSQHRETFHPFPPGYHLIPGFFISYFWIYDFNEYPVKTGASCCSEKSISFHLEESRSNTMMYLMEYFIYHLRPYNGLTYY